MAIAKKSLVGSRPATKKEKPVVAEPAATGDSKSLTANALKGMEMKRMKGTRAMAITSFKAPN